MTTSDEPKKVPIPLELSDTQAQALAQFVKRVGWHEMRDNAADEREAYNIRSAISSLGAALAVAGYAPR